MRNSFYEYYGLSQKEFDKLWKDALVVFDTNILLSLYRLPIEARNEILAVMKEFKNRLWLPFQVGYEFHEHRLEEANRPVESLKSPADRFSKFSDEIERDYGRNPYISNFKYVKDSLKSLHSRIDKKANEWIAGCPDMMHEDTVLSELTSLYDGKVGKPYDDARLGEIYKEGIQRYDNDVPPGYKDKNKGTGDRHKYGDLIIWFQILEKAKESNSDILFVTDDQKEDWWGVYKGNIVGPRHELITEFRKSTGNHLLGFYTTERFLYYAKKKSGVSVKTKTLEEVKTPKTDWTKLWEQSSEPGQMSLGAIGSYPFISLEDSGQPELGKSSLLRMSEGGFRLSDASFGYDYESLSSFGKSGRKRLFNTSPVTEPLSNLKTIDGSMLEDQSSDNVNDNEKDSNNDNQTE